MRKCKKSKSILLVQEGRGLGSRDTHTVSDLLVHCLLSPALVACMNLHNTDSCDKKTSKLASKITIPVDLTIKEQK